VKGSEQPAKIFVEFEVVNALPFSVMGLASGHEYFLDYKNSPLFKRAAAKDFLNAEGTRAGHLRWSALSVTVHLELPEHFSLAAQ
jgi:hypothetical protein